MSMAWRPAMMVKSLLNHKTWEETDDGINQDMELSVMRALKMRQSRHVWEASLTELNLVMRNEQDALVRNGLFSDMMMPIDGFILDFGLEPIAKREDEMRSSLRIQPGFVRPEGADPEAFRELSYECTRDYCKFLSGMWDAIFFEGREQSKPPHVDITTDMAEMVPFALLAGHKRAVFYTILAKYGMRVQIGDLKRCTLFNQWDKVIRAGHLGNGRIWVEVGRFRVNLKLVQKAKIEMGSLMPAYGYGWVGIDFVKANDSVNDEQAPMQDEEEPEANPADDDQHAT